MDVLGVGTTQSIGAPFLSTVGCTQEIHGADGILNLIDGDIGSPFGLNDAGQIFTQDGKYKYTLLTPVPEPSALTLVSSVAIVIMLRRARQKYQIALQWTSEALARIPPV